MAESPPGTGRTPALGQAEQLGEEVRRLLSVLRGDDGVVEGDGHQSSELPSVETSFQWARRRARSAGRLDCRACAERCLRARRPTPMSTVPAWTPHPTSPRPARHHRPVQRRWRADVADRMTTARARSGFVWHLRVDRRPRPNTVELGIAADGRRRWWRQGIMPEVVDKCATDARRDPTAYRVGVLPRRYNAVGRCSCRPTARATEMPTRAVCGIPIWAGPDA